MKAGGGKRKGNGYEIKIARILTKWYVQDQKHVCSVKTNKPIDLFWRTAGSGAKATRGKGAETSFFGDITYLPDPDALQVWIDCKSVKNVTFNNIMLPSFLPYQWYGEELIKQDDLKIEKPVLIIFKLYRKKENFIFFSWLDFEKVCLDKSITINNDYVVTELDRFLNSIDKDEIVNS